jgi:Ni,Fe-hydrogenase III small subunit
MCLSFDMLIISKGQCESHKVEVQKLTKQAHDATAFAVEESANWR